MVDPVLQVLVRHNRIEPVVEDALHALAFAAPIHNPAQRAQDGGDAQQLRHIECAARFRPAQGIRYVLEAAKGRRTKARHHGVGLVRFRQKAFYLGQGRGRAQILRQFRRRVTGGLFRQ